MKQPLTLDEQIKYLEGNKNIKFDDKEEAKKFLYNNNYINIISSVKIYMHHEIIDNKHTYKETNFEEWKRIYALDKQVSKKILLECLKEEQKINSKLAYELTFLIENELKPDQKKQIKQLIRDTKFGKMNNYNYDETWLYVNHFTFGETIKILKRIESFSKENKKIESSINKILFPMSIQKLKTIKNFRNQVAHNIPMLIHLTPRKDEVDYALKRKERLEYYKYIIGEDDFFKAAKEYKKTPPSKKME